MSWLDHIGITIGVVFFIIFLVVRAENKPRLSFLQVIKANLKLGRGWEILFSFILCFAILYFFGYLILILFFTNREILRLNQDTGHIPIPFITVLLTSQLYDLVVRKGSKSLVKSKELSNLIRLLIYFNEVTIYFWRAAVSYAISFFAAEIITNEDSNSTITMLFEKKKLAISLKRKSFYPLVARYFAIKVHLLMDHYGYNALNSLLLDKNFKKDLHNLFKTDKGEWDGRERRQKNIYTQKRRRIGDFKHIKSAINEGLRFD